MSTVQNFEVMSKNFNIDKIPSKKKISMKIIVIVGVSVKFRPSIFSGLLPNSLVPPP
jgi:hypothetical protein